MLYCFSIPFQWHNTDSQPQIAAEESTIKGRNVRPGLCPKMFMHETMLRIFYVFSPVLYIFLDSILHRMLNCVAI